MNSVAFERNFSLLSKLARDNNFILTFNEAEKAVRIWVGYDSHAVSLEGDWPTRVKSVINYLALKHSSGVNMHNA